MCKEATECEGPDGLTSGHGTQAQAHDPSVVQVSNRHLPHNHSLASVELGLISWVPYHQEMDIASYKTER